MSCRGLPGASPGNRWGSPGADGRAPVREECHRRRGERQMLRPLLLGVVRGLGPDAALEVDLRPPGRQDLTDPRASQELEANGVRRAPVRVRRQDAEQPLQLGVGKPALATLLMVALDSLDRIVAAHAPVDRQGEHLGQQGQQAVRLIGRVASSPHAEHGCRARARPRPSCCRCAAARVARAGSDRSCTLRGRFFGTACWARYCSASAATWVLPEQRARPAQGRDH